MARLLASATALALVAATVTFPVGDAAAQARISDPEAVRCAGVTYAKEIRGDRDPNGTPVKTRPDPRGRYVPVLMVHGWTGRSTHDGERRGAFSHTIDLTSIVGTKTAGARSLIGQLQLIPGAAVYTFDYHEYSARWVTDEQLGPAFGAAIDCLYQAGGEKVIVVAHSMGGLLTRWALNQPGKSRADKVSTVVTFGTPQAGSLIADLLGRATDIPHPVASTLRILLAYCGNQASQRISTGSFCDVLPGPLRAFQSDAGIALRSGSVELGELAPVPEQVHLLALAGDTTLRLFDFGWFGLRPWDDVNVPVGDIIVTAGSAHHVGDEKYKARCTYQLDAVQGALDEIAMRLKMVHAGAAPQSILNVQGPCFHNNLMRTRELTNHATGAIHDDITARSSPVLRRVLQPLRGTWVYECGDLDVKMIVTADNTATVTKTYPTYRENPRYMTERLKLRLAVENGRPVAIFDGPLNPRRQTIELSERGNVMRLPHVGEVHKQSYEDYTC